MYECFSTFVIHRFYKIGTGRYAMATCVEEQIQNPDTCISNLKVFFASIRSKASMTILDKRNVLLNAGISGGVLFPVTSVLTFLPKIKRTENSGIVLVHLPGKRVY